MPPTKRNPYEDKAIADVYDACGKDVDYTAKHFNISETEVRDAVLADTRNAIPRMPPGCSKGLRLVPNKEAA